MAVITVSGLSGSLSGSLGEVVNLAKELLLAGFDVRVDGCSGAIYYGPGYDSVVFPSADKGTALDALTLALFEGQSS